MADYTHLPYDKTSAYGQLIQGVMSPLSASVQRLIDLVGTMDTMKESGVVGEYMRSKFGFPDVATMQAAYDELTSLLGKVATDATVDHVYAAITQAFHKFT
jgi:hypothetical protein